jgi:hypothetical protein
VFDSVWLIATVIMQRAPPPFQASLLRRLKMQRLARLASLASQVL